MAAAPATISGFLEALANDAGLAAKFEETPVGVMVDFGLDDRQRDLILNKPIADIRNEVAKELQAQSAGATVYVIRVKHG
jgi:hypothetical protein